VPPLAPLPPKPLMVPPLALLSVVSVPVLLTLIP
jgi:hypothetical protein